jgi:hypothetical protein
VSVTDGAETGIGWEVWFLACIAVAGTIVAVLALTTLGIDSAGLDSPAVGTMAAPTPEPRRMAVGLSGAVFFGAVSALLVRTTEW